MKCGDHIELSKVLSSTNPFEGLVYLRKRVAILPRKMVKGSVINVELEAIPGLLSE
jgi:hypothetical protein